MHTDTTLSKPLHCYWQKEIFRGSSTFIPQKEGQNKWKLYSRSCLVIKIRPTYLIKGMYIGMVPQQGPLKGNILLQNLFLTYLTFTCHKETSLSLMSLIRCILSCE